MLHHPVPIWPLEPQIITDPTRYDLKNPEKATLLDVILTTTPKLYQSGVFCNNLCDHCFISCVCNRYTAKQPGLLCFRRLKKACNEQALLHDLATVEWSRISLIPTIEEARLMFYDLFNDVVKKYASLRKMRIKNRFLPWPGWSSPAQEQTLEQSSAFKVESWLALFQADKK